MEELIFSSISFVGKNRQEVVDHYTCVSGGEYLDVFIPPKPKVLNPKPKGDGKKKEPFGPILAFQLFQVIINFLAELTFTFIGADSTRVNTGIFRNKQGCHLGLKITSALTARVFRFQYISDIPDKSDFQKMTT